MNSILKKAKKKNINTKYFPYIVIKDALDDDLYEKLVKNYPSLEEISISHSEICQNKKKIKNNSRYNMNAEYSLKNDKLSKEWKEFISYHTSDDFYREILKLFKKDIKQIYPDIENTLGKKFKELKTNIRFDDNKKDISLDCQISMNSPVINDSAVRGLHIDEPNKLFAGLLYFKDKNDNSVGGDLEIYKFNDEYPKINNLDFNKYQNKLSNLQQKNSNKIKKIDTIKYEKNVLVFFINSKKSLHSVSIRKKTEHNRKFVNFIGSFNNINELF